MNREHSAHVALTATEFAQRWTPPTNPKAQKIWTSNRVPLTTAMIEQVIQEIGA